VAFLINMSVPVVVSLALIFLFPSTSGALRMTLAYDGYEFLGDSNVIEVTVGHVRQVKPTAMKLQMVGFRDGRQPD
jgi:hypothetical protein